MAAEREIELKLNIAPRDIWRLLRLPILRVATMKKMPGKRLISTYYDTADQRLREHSIAVRLRQVNGVWLQAVKSEGRVVAGLHDRHEWECATRANTFDFRDMPDEKFKSTLEKILNDEPLQAAFTTDFTRVSRIVQLGNDTQCELSIDSGRIVANGNEQAISEIELELIDGNSRMLFEFARELMTQIPLSVGHESKAQRGFALQRGDTAAPEKARPPALEKHMDTRQGFVAIAAACVQHLTANEAGCLLGDDPEFLHQMRVAIRRLRTAVQLFSDHLDEPAVLAIGTELRWLGAELGATRDWDVFLEESIAPLLTALPDHAGLGNIQERLRARRDAVATTSAAAIQTLRYQHLLLDLGAWLTELSHDSDAANESAKLIDFARDALKRQRKQLIRRAANLLELTPEERHRVRISSKRLRYAAEFFSPLFSAKLSKRYIQELANLQAILGSLNDTATSAALVDQIADEQDGEAVALIRAWSSGVASGHRAHLDQAHERFLKQSIFW